MSKVATLLPTREQSINEDARIRRAAAIYDYLEMEISDLVTMAKIANRIVNETIGDTDFNPTTKEVSRHDLTDDSITETIFIVGHLSRMVESLERKYLTGNEEQ
jgi:hypothetical protein